MGIRKSRWACCLVAVFLLLVRDAAWAWDIPDNPDRYLSVIYIQNALEAVNGHQNTVNPSSNSDRSMRVFSMNTLLTTVLPLSRRWSLTAGGGVNFNEFETAAAATQSSTVNDNSVAVYLGGLRFFFSREAASYAIAERNPDRWVSLGLQASGTNTVPYDVTASNGNILQSLYSHSLTLSSEDRFPLADWYTLDTTVSGAYSRTDIGAAPSLRSTTTQMKTLGGTLEQRFYFVGKNLIADDRGGNPDRWSMVYLGVNGGGTLSGKVSVEPRPGKTDSTVLNNDLRSLGGYLGVRLPMTEHSTFKLEVDYAYAYTITAAAPLDGIAEARNRTALLGGSASFRYYFH